VANIFLNLPVPAGDGSGAAVDVSTQGSLKTIVVGVTPGASGEGMRCTLNVELSCAAVAPVNDDEWSPVATFQQDLGGDLTVTVACKWMRVRRSGSKTPNGTPSCKVGSTGDGALVGNLPATAGDGSGASLNVSTFGPWKTVSVGSAFRGNVNIEVSEDGVFFAPQFSFINGGQQSGAFMADFMRVTRDGVPVISPGLPVVNVGATAVPGGGGGGGGSGNAQRFTYVVTGVEAPSTSDFTVPLPVARANNLYLIWGSQGVATLLLAWQFPNGAGDRTVNGFRIVSSLGFTAGDTIMFYVDDPA
jgi:hypothetical protein